MRRSTRLSRQSETADLPVVDENSAFVANVKTDQSPRVSTESKRRSLRDSSMGVVVKSIDQQDLLGKLESIEAEFKQKSQMLASGGEGWTETSDQTPERTSDRESAVWNDVNTPATVTPNRRSSVWKDVATPTPAEGPAGVTSSEDNAEIEVAESDPVAKEVDNLDLNEEEILNDVVDEDSANNLEVDDNRVSALTEPDFDDNELDGDADDIDELALAVNKDNVEQEENVQEEEEEAELPAPPTEEAEEVAMPPPAPTAAALVEESVVTNKPSPITKPLHVDNADDDASKASTVVSEQKEEGEKVPKRSSLNLSSMMTAKIDKGLGQKHGGVDLTLASNMPVSEDAEEEKPAPAVKKAKSKAAPVPTAAPTRPPLVAKTVPKAVPAPLQKRAAPVVPLRDRKAPIEAAVAAGINLKKKTVVPVRAAGTVGVGAHKTTISNRTSVVTASTASTQAGMRRPFAGSKDLVSSTFNTSLKPKQATGTSATSTSTSASRAAVVKAAKDRAEEQRATKVATLKAKWAQEKEAKLQKNAQERQHDLERLNKLSTAAAAARKHALERKRSKEEEKKRLEAEELAVKVEDRLHVKKVVEEEDRRRRRESGALRATMRERAEATTAVIVEEQEERERGLLESRRQDAQQVKAYKEKEREDRRESMAVRGTVAQRERQEAALWAQQSKDEEIGLIESRRAGWEDEQQYKQNLRSARRQSMAGRLDVWRRQKAEVEEDRVEQMNGEVEQLELRREDWKAREAAKKEQKHEEREETVDRLDQWRKEKTMEAAWKAEDAERDALERELQAAELEDVKNFQAKLQGDRRQSLAFRLDKSRIDSEYDRNHKQLEREIADEETRLHEQDREDVRAGKQAVIASRRMSLEYRSQRAVQQKRQEEGDSEYKRQLEAQDRELSEEAWRDVKRYQEKCREEQRKEIACSLLQQQKDHSYALEQHQESLERLHEDMELRRKDWKAVKAAKKADGARRRKSISMRLDSWRAIRLKEAKKKVAELAQADEEARIREEDREALQRHKKNMQLEQLQDDFTHGFVL